jgi:hypothetical protein
MWFYNGGIGCLGGWDGNLVGWAIGWCENRKKVVVMMFERIKEKYARRR